MAVFVIADLHLDISEKDKSMEIFGARWNNYTERIKANWNKLVGQDDTVVIPGDISWGLTIEAAKNDLLWINELPGKKIIMKGNHDFWWSTLSKMKKFFEANEIDTIEPLNNNAIETKKFIIAGSRGWFVDKSIQSTELNVDYDKIINREIMRLKMSLDAAKNIQKSTDKEIKVFFHFPPVWGEYCCHEIIDVLKEYEINSCYFGHIHGCYNVNEHFVYEDIDFNIVSADYLNFIPLFIG